MNNFTGQLVKLPFFFLKKKKKKVTMNFKNQGQIRKIVTVEKFYGSDKQKMVAKNFAYLKVLIKIFDYELLFVFLQ